MVVTGIVTTARMTNHVTARLLCPNRQSSPLASARETPAAAAGIRDIQRPGSGGRMPNRTIP